MNGKLIHVSHEEAEIRRELLTSTYYMGRYVLGYDRLLPEVHGQWGWALDRLPYPRRLILRPRKTYKTTFYTMSYPLRRLAGDPNLRILLVNAVYGNAAGFLREIKGHCERNARFRRWCGDWVSPKWNEQAVDIRPRTVNRKEASLSIAGYGSALVSAHYDLIIVDDLVNEDDRTSARVRQKKIAWFRDCISLLDVGGELVVVGTRWHPDDLYGWLMRELNPTLAPSERYAVEADGCFLEDGVTPRYPTILSADVLAALPREIGYPNFAANYLNDPRPSGSVMFDLSEMREVEALPVAEYAEIVGFCDPALGKSNLGCYSAVVTVGVRHDDMLDILDADLQRLPPDALLAVIARKHAYYRYAVFGIESNNFQERLIAELQTAVPHLYVRGVPHRSDKLGRIQGLQPLFAKGQLRILAEWRHRYPLLIDQLLGCQLDTLPPYVDGPDALEGAVSLVRARYDGSSDAFPEDPYYGSIAPRRRSSQEILPYEREYEEDPYEQDVADAFSQGRPGVGFERHGG